MDDSGFDALDVHLALSPPTADEINLMLRNYRQLTGAPIIVSQAEFDAAAKAGISADNMLVQQTIPTD